MDTRFLYACRVWILCSLASAMLVLIAPLTPAHAGPGDISTVAGGYIGDGGPAASARINSPSRVAVDGAGNVYIMDTYNQRVRMVTGTTITTVAGNGISAFTGDNALAVAASINEANGVAVDAAGNIYIADSFNQRIRKVNASNPKNISTVAGSGGLGYGGFGGDDAAATSASLNYPYSVTTDTRGNMYIADANNNRIRVVNSGGTISTIAGNGTGTFAGDGDSTWNSSLNYPTDVAIDSSGNIYIADTNNHRIRKVNMSTYIITTVAGNGTAAFAGDGNLAVDASLNGPFGVALDSSGNLYIADKYNNRIRKVDTAGYISTVAGSGQYDYSGDGSSATSAGLRYPAGVAVDASGNIYIADQNNDCIRKVTASTGWISTIAGNPINAVYGNNGPAASASLNYAHGVGADANGNVYIADTKNMMVRKVTPAGVITTIAGIGPDSGGYGGFGGDGSSATAAQLNNPYGVAADAAGNVYIADSYNNRIRKVTASNGYIDTVAGDGTATVLNGPRGVAVDGAGNIYIADTDNHRIRKVTGVVISTIAGIGTAAFSGDSASATLAGLNTPTGVALDTAGNIYIADSGNNRIRKINASDGKINTVAGNGVSAFSGDGASATAASLATPYGVAVDAAGTIYIADFYNSKIRKVTSGTISTVAGNGISGVSIGVFLGYAGDGGKTAPTGYSILNNAYSVAVDPAGNVYFTDVNNWRVRKISESAAPTLASVHIASSNTSTARAKTGDTVTITLTSSEPISTPTVTIAGHGATESGSGTSWSASFIMTATDTNGAVPFSISFTDLAGNAGSVVSTTTDGSGVTFDRLAPTLTSVHIASNNAATTRAKTGDLVTLSFIASEPVATPTATIAGHAAAVTGSGTTWSAGFTMTGTDAEGTVPFSISFSDLAGNPGVAVSAATDTSSVAFDKTAPTLLTVHIASSNANTARAKTGDTVTVTITSSEPISTPTVTIAGHGATESGSGTSWSASFIMTVTDTEGSIPFSIAFSDLAGNPGSPVSAVTDASAVAFDRTAPTLTSVHIASNNPATTRAKTGDLVTLSFISSEPVATPTATIAGHGAAVTGSGTTWSAGFTMTGTDTEGAVPFSISFSDLFGNGGTQVSATTDLSAVAFDRTAPATAASAAGYTFGSWTALSGVTVTLTATDAGAGVPAGSTKYCFAATNDCTPNLSYTAPFSVTCAAGSTCTQYVRYLSVDGAGNTETAASQTVNQDRQAPGLNASAAFIDSTHVDVTFSEIVSGATASTNYTGSGGLVIASAALQSGNTYRLTTSVQTVGTTYTIAANTTNITDQVGNTLNAGSASATFVRQSASNTAPTTPVLSAPATNSETTSVTPSLTVANSSDIDSDIVRYEFEVDTVVTFDSGSRQSAANVAAGAGSTGWAPSPLQDNTTYYWRVRATDGDKTSLWMTTANVFVNTANDTPTVPAVSSPSNNSQVSSLTPLVSITNSSDADRFDTVTYDFDIATDSGFLNIVANVIGKAQGTGTTQFQSSSLTDNMRHYWRARSRDNHGSMSNWVTASFIVNTSNDAPSAPSLSAPANTSELASVTPQLTVVNGTDLDGDVLQYLFEVDTVNTFNSPDKKSSGYVAAGTGTTAWTPSALTDNSTWYWRVKAYDGLADSSWMATASFFVNTANDAPTAPVLSNPANNGTATVLAPTLQIVAATDPDMDGLTYEYAVYSNSGLTNAVANTTGAGTSWTINQSLSDNTWYWWRARAWDVHGTPGSWMTTGRFFVNNNGFNDPPTITVTAPTAAEPIAVGGTFTINWSAADPDSDPLITLFYDTVGSGHSSGTQIAANILMSGQSSYSWDISALAEGTYYVYAKIDDGTTVSYDYAPGPIIRMNSNGDADGNATVDIFDALKALRFAVGIDAPAAADVARSDVAPLVNGKPAPDGKIDISDVVVILRKAAGLTSW